MSADLTKLLEDWPYEPGKINVRLIEGDDGEQRIQLRLDLGIMQMHATGRPDGQRPGGYESLLEYHEARLDEHIAQSGSPAGFTLTEDECRELREEAVQYYHRYVCMMVLEDFEAVVRDATRNIRVLDLCSKHSQTESDRAILEQFRPYITMMRARALASQAIKDNEPKAALHALDEGLENLRQHFSAAGQMDTFDESSEVQMLRGMRDSLTPKLPVSEKAELKRRSPRPSRRTTSSPPSLRRASADEGLSRSPTLPVKPAAPLQLLPSHRPPPSVSAAPRPPAGPSPGSPCRGPSPAPPRSPDPPPARWPRSPGSGSSSAAMNTLGAKP